MCPRPPTDKPQFTVKTLRDAIPAHCFQRSTVRSFSYLLVDLVAVAALYYASTWIDHPVVPRVLAYGCLWPLYWFFQVGYQARKTWELSSAAAAPESSWQQSREGIWRYPWWMLLHMPSTLH